MKKHYFFSMSPFLAPSFLMVTLFLLVLVTACSAPAPVAEKSTHSAEVILYHYAARDFLEGEIPQTDLDLILDTGVRAPSARNLQPWHFTVVQNNDLAKKMLSNNVDGNILIVVSAFGDGKTNGVQILDCALAVENIYLAAQALGYGSRIYTGPMDELNRDLKGELGLPQGYNAVALVRVGKVAEGVDAVSAASRRKSPEEVVIYRK